VLLRETIYERGGLEAVCAVLDEIDDACERLAVLRLLDWRHVLAGGGTLPGPIRWPAKDGGIHLMPRPGQQIIFTAQGRLEWREVGEVLDERSSTVAD
jgi:hypothetical protein